MLLTLAESALDRNDVHYGWSYVHATQRELVHLLSEHEVYNLAVVLRPEALEKLVDWRLQAAKDILGIALAESAGTLINPEQNEQGEPGEPANVGAPQIATPVLQQKSIHISKLRDAVVQVMKLRDQHFDNVYLRVRLVRSQLTLTSFYLFLLLLAVSGHLGFSVWDETPSTSDPHLLFNVLSMGGIGAALSTMLQLTNLVSLEQKIPEKLLDKYLTSARPLIGMASALVVYYFLKSDFINIGDLTHARVLAVAFASGFTERLVLSLADKVA